MKTLKASDINYVTLDDDRNVLQCYSTYESARLGAWSDDADYVRPAWVQTVPDNDHGDSEVETGQAWRVDLDSLRGVDDDVNDPSLEEYYQLRIVFGNSHVYAVQLHGEQ